MNDTPTPAVAQPTFPDAFSSYPQLLTSGIGYDPFTGDVYQFQAGNLVKIGTATPEEPGVDQQSASSRSRSRKPPKDDD